MIGPAGICFACRHLERREESIEDRTSSGDRPATCTAFPKGIPDSIYHGGFDHRRPFPDDGGVRFELKEGREEDLEAYEKVVLTG